MVMLAGCVCCHKLLYIGGKWPVGSIAVHDVLLSWCQFAYFRRLWCVFLGSLTLPLFLPQFLGPSMDGSRTNFHSIAFGRKVC
jgi:hypothetical protein